MSMNDASETSSQPMNKTKTSSANTSSKMAAMNALISV